MTFTPVHTLTSFTLPAATLCWPSLFSSLICEAQLDLASAILQTIPQSQNRTAELNEHKALTEPIELHILRRMSTSYIER